jgi:hypothetical protein
VETKQMLQRGWAVLEPRGDGQLSSFPLDVRSDDEICRLAVDRSGARHLLVPVGAEQPVAPQHGSALNIEQRQLIFGEVVHSYIDLSCVQPELYVEFDDVVEDVIDAVRDAVDTGRATLDVVDRWKRLFRAGLFRGLGADALRGLFAELCCLSSLLEVEPGLDATCWTGPLGRPHDFELPAACIEVKALGTRSDHIHVHGLDQLDTHDGKALYLAVLTVADDPEGRSIAELVDELADRIADPNVLRRRLSSVGWTSDMSDGERYAVTHVIGVPVADAVPRLVAQSLRDSELPEGVGNVAYSVDRKSLLPFAVDGSLTDIARKALG